MSPAPPLLYSLDTTGRQRCSRCGMLQDCWCFGGIFTATFFSKCMCRICVHVFTFVLITKICVCSYPHVCAWKRHFWHRNIIRVWKKDVFVCKNDTDTQIFSYTQIFFYENRFCIRTHTFFRRTHQCFFRHMDHFATIILSSFCHRRSEGAWSDVSVTSCALKGGSQAQRCSTSVLTLTEQS